MSDDEKKTISYDDYLRLLGLGLLVQEAIKFVDQITESIAGIAGVERDHYDAFDWVSDAVWDGDVAAAVLRRLRVAEPSPVAGEGGGTDG